MKVDEQLIFTDTRPFEAGWFELFALRLRGWTDVESAHDLVGFELVKIERHRGKKVLKITPKGRALTEIKPFPDLRASSSIYATFLVQKDFHETASAPTDIDDALYVDEKASFTNDIKSWVYKAMADQLDIEAKQLANAAQSYRNLALKQPSS